MALRQAIVFTLLALLGVGLAAPRCALAVKEPNSAAGADSGGTVAYWTWSGMVDYDDPDLSTGHGHAGGPGAYGAFTFSGTGIDVYAVKCPAVAVDQRAHKTGKVKISLDGKVIDTVSLLAPDKDAHVKVAGITGLSNGNHVLEVEPVEGWIIIDSVKVLGDSAPEAPGALPAAVSRTADKHLVAYWPFHEGRGVVASDKSGHGNTATLQAGAAWSPDGKMGAGSISFPSAGGVETSGPVVDTSHSFTVCAWVKLANTSGYQTFVSQDGSTVSGFYLQLRDDTHQFAFTMISSDASLGGTFASANFAPQPGVWYHLAGVYDAPANTLALFVNGTLQGTQPFSTPWQAYGHTVVGRGKFDGKYLDFTTAEINEVRIYDAALSPAAIMSLYDSGR